MWHVYIAVIAKPTLFTLVGEKLNGIQIFVSSFEWKWDESIKRISCGLTNWLSFALYSINVLIGQLSFFHASASDSHVYCASLSFCFRRTNLNYKFSCCFSIRILSKWHKLFWTISRHGHYEWFRHSSSLSSRGHWSNTLTNVHDSLLSSTNSANTWRFFRSCVSHIRCHGRRFVYCSGSRLSWLDTSTLRNKNENDR